MKCLLIAIVCVLLTACKPQVGVDYFLTHPAEANKVFGDCKTNSNTKACPSAKRAMQTIALHAMLLQANPQEFGRTVLKNQMLIGQLRQALNKASAKERSEITQTLNKARQLNTHYLALIAWLQA